MSYSFTFTRQHIPLFIINPWTIYLPLPDIQLKQVCLCLNAIDLRLSCISRGGGIRTPITATQKQLHFIVAEKFLYKNLYDTRPTIRRHPGCYDTKNGLQLKKTFKKAAIHRLFICGIPQFRLKECHCTFLDCVCHSLLLGRWDLNPRPTD